MSQIDLKFTTVSLQDGYAGTKGSPVVNHSGGYSVAATTMVVGGVVGALAVGDTFTLAGDVTVYTITAHTETSLNTTSITFTPGLVIAATDTEVITILAHSLQIKIGSGTLTHDEKRKMEYILDRGRLSTVREGDEEPMDVKLDILWEFLKSVSGATVPTPEEVLKHTGPASTWLTSASDPCEPYALDVVINYDPPCPSVQGETITFHDFRWESIAHDPKAGTLVCTGKCNHKTATLIRRANTYTP